MFSVFKSDLIFEKGKETLVMDEEKKIMWIRIIAIIAISFIAAYLAFYFALASMVHKMTDPMYNAKRIEKIVKQQERKMQRLESDFSENPFEPKMRPMIVNLVRENNEYQVIVDLKPLNGDVDGVNVNYEDGVLSVSGEADENIRGTEKIISFAQSYYLDEKLDISKMKKEKKGNKCIITIPLAE